MPRLPRLDAPGVTHHIMVRGVDGTDIFRVRSDYHDFAGRLTRLLPEGDARCLAWALMPNHVHLVVRMGTQGVSRLMRRLNTGYALRFNRRHERRGVLFQGRFRSRLVADEGDLANVIRYVHMNPVKAGLVGSVDALARFPWTGHPALLGVRPPHAFEAVEDALEAIGPDQERARNRLASWMRRVPVARPSAAAPVQPTPRPSPASPLAFAEDAGGRLGLDDLVDVVASWYQLTPADLASGRRAQPIPQARAVVSALGVTRLGIGPVRLAPALGVTAAAVSAAIPRGLRAIEADGFPGRSATPVPNSEE